MYTILHNNVHAKSQFILAWSGSPLIARSQLTWNGETGETQLTWPTLISIMGKVAKVYLLKNSSWAIILATFNPNLYYYRRYIRLLIVKYLLQRLLKDLSAIKLLSKHLEDICSNKKQSITSWQLDATSNILSAIIEIMNYMISFSEITLSQT